MSQRILGLLNFLSDYDLAISGAEIRMERGEHVAVRPEETPRFCTVVLQDGAPTVYFTNTLVVPVDVSTFRVGSVIEAWCCDLDAEEVIELQPAFAYISPEG